MDKTAKAWDTTLILSQFDYAADTTWQAAAKATYDVAKTRDGQAAADLVRARFAARGIVFALTRQRAAARHWPGSHARRAGRQLVNVEPGGTQLRVLCEGGDVAADLPRWGLSSYLFG